MTNILPLLPAGALAAQLQPYKKLLGVLVRNNCISFALSNPYLNLAEPLGAVMLREGRLSVWSLERMLNDQQLSGYIVGCEVDAGLEQPQQQPPAQQLELQVTQQQERALQQVQGALARMRPGLAGGWYGSWSAAGGASCRILPPAGPAAAAAAAAGPGVEQRLMQNQEGNGIAGSSSISSSGGGGVGEPQRCSLGQQFLQDYLDSLGALNTFG